MRKQLVFAALLLTGCASTTKIPVTATMTFTSSKNEVIVEDEKVFCLRLSQNIFWLPEPGDTLIVKKETLPFGIWPVYTYEKTK